MPSRGSLEYLWFSAASQTDLDAFSEVFDDIDCPNYFWTTADPNHFYERDEAIEAEINDKQRRRRRAGRRYSVVLKYQSRTPRAPRLSELSMEEIERKIGALGAWGRRVEMVWLNVDEVGLMFMLEFGRYYNTSRLGSSGSS